jgi:prepilin-type N-terminal cleavage/methylation domain-containing protein
MPQHHSGFTLIEVLTVVAIIGILVVTSFFAWKLQFTKAKDAERKDDLKRLRIAFEEYYTDNEAYPPADAISTCGSDSLKPYLNSIPCDPLTGIAYCYILDPDNPASPQSFRLLTTLGNLKDSDIAKLGCDTPAYCGWETSCSSTGGSGYNYGVSSTNVSIANATPEEVPGEEASPAPIPGRYACTPEGVCNDYGGNAKDCPLTFSNARECHNYCPTSAPAERCPY